jgi:hypothetical protein
MASQMLEDIRQRAWLRILSNEMLEAEKQQEWERQRWALEEVDWVEDQLSKEDISDCADWDTLETGGYKEEQKAKRTGTLLDWYTVVPARGGEDSQDAEGQMIAMMESDIL